MVTRARRPLSDRDAADACTSCAARLEAPTVGSLLPEPSYLQITRSDYIGSPLRELESQRA